MKNHNININAYLVIENIFENKIEIFINKIFENIKILYLTNVIQKRNKNFNIVNIFKNDNSKIINIFRNENEISIIIKIFFNYIFINN